jgi:hypothetical protein
MHVEQSTVARLDKGIDRVSSRRKMSAKRERAAVTQSRAQSPRVSKANLEHAHATLQQNACH